jgi:serine/threonine protein kinase
MPTIDRAQSVFVNALQISDQEVRRAYLDAECRGAPELRRDVEGLIQHAERMGDFLEHDPTEDGENDLPMTVDTPFSGTARGPVTTKLDPGHKIGPYKIREKIAEGGMGAVYVAEQSKPVRRKVALKVIRPGVAGENVVARFEAERQALAMMDHPNIARVLDGGATEQELPYFVMELVQGLPITEYCDHHRLTIDQRLKLFEKVCRAVQHAHQKGIVHRDLKPSNVLVATIDGQAVPKVIDFGVAKAISQKLTDQTIYTHFSQVVGTPLYMSPEQAELGVIDIDTRSDVYSLGVLLYELLTGSTPFDRETLQKATFDEMRRIIREDEPRRPSAMIETLVASDRSTVSERRGKDPRKLCEALAGELDWIVMKALDKDRNRRYESASELADEVDRYLDDEPVEACPPSMAYRLRKFARRHKGLLTTTAIVLLALLTATVVSTWYAIEANQSRRIADENLRLSQADFDRATNTIDMVVAKLGSGEFSGDPEVEALQDIFLPVAVSLYEEIVSEHGEDRLSRERQAASLVGLTWIYRGTRDLNKSVSASEAAEGILRELIADFPDDGKLKLALAEVHYQRGWVLEESDPVQQVEQFERAIALGREALNQAEDTDAAVKARHQIANATSGLASVLIFKLRDPERAATLAQEAVRVSNGTPDLYDDVFSLSNLAWAEFRLGKLEQAEVSSRRALDLAREQLTSQDGNDELDRTRMLFNALKLLASIQKARQDPIAAAASNNEAFQLARQLRDQFPNSAQFRDWVVSAGVTDQPSLDALLDGELALAERMFARGRIDLLKTLLKNRKLNMLLARVGRLKAEGHHEQSRLLGSDLISAFKQMLIESEYPSSRLLLDRARLFAAMDDLAAAQEDLETAVALSAKEGSKSEQAASLNNLAWLLATTSERTLRDPDRAVELAAKAVEIRPTSSVFWNTLGVAYYRDGEFEMAIDSLEKSDELESRYFGYNGIFIAMAHHRLGNEDEARDFYERSIAWRKEHGSDEELDGFYREAEELFETESGKPQMNDEVEP